MRRLDDLVDYLMNEEKVKGFNPITFTPLTFASISGRGGNRTHV